MHTYTDALHHIETALGERAPAHKVDAIADQIYAENGGTWDLRDFDTGRFWTIVETHALTLTVDWVGGDDDYNATWNITTDAEGELAGGAIKATEDEEDSLASLAAAVTAQGYRLGDRTSETGDIETYAVTTGGE